MGNISFRIAGKTTDGSGTGVRLTIRMLNSDRAPLTTNELPCIFNALKRSEAATERGNDCFTYRFPFALSQGDGFSYVFPFAIATFE